MTSGLDEVQAGVNAVINNFLAVNPVLLLQVGVESRLDVIHNGLPAEETRTASEDDTAPQTNR